MAKYWARICRDLVSSQRLTALLARNTFAEALYWRLKAMSDDYGRFFGTAEDVGSACCPRNLIRGDFTLEQVGQALADMEACGCIYFYEIEGRRYLELCDYLTHAHTDWTHVGHPEYPTPPGWIAPRELVDWIRRHAKLRTVTLERFGLTAANWPPGVECPFASARKGTEYPSKGTEGPSH